MGRARYCEQPKPGNKGQLFPSCRGDVHTIHARKGTPTKWIRVGSLCLRCHFFEPDYTTGILSRPPSRLPS